MRIIYLITKIKKKLTKLPFIILGLTTLFKV